MRPLPLEAEPEDATVAVWYVHLGRGDYYQLYASEQDAAAAAAGIDLYTDDAVVGAQFADGRLVDVNEWPAYKAAYAALRAREAERRANQPALPPTREALAPFCRRTIRIELTEPGWLGLPVPPQGEHP
jgi:hypothetical protein